MNDNPSRKIAYRSYAKVNLYLDVLDRRHDGFTNIETIFQTVDLWDELTFAPRDTGTHVTCNLPNLSNSEDNLVYRAAELLRAKTGATTGVSIHLEKRIPVAAGLAGGSGNAAATLIALNEFWALGLDVADLDALARRLGSDVPYCLVGGTVAATGRGEILESLDPIDPQWLVLVHPPLAITAGHAYGHPRLARNPETPARGKTPAFQNALDQLARGNITNTIFNRMESGVFHDHPELNTIKIRLRELGCTACAMSGSGPTVFGLFPDEPAARRAGQAIEDYAVTILQTAPRGVVRQP